MSILSAATMAARRTSRKAPEDQAREAATVSEALPDDLAAVDDAKLIAEIIGRNESEALDEDSVEKLIEAPSPDGYEFDDHAAIESAADWWRRGDRREALHYLEIALGSDFHGLGDLKPEDLR